MNKIEADKNDNIGTVLVVGAGISGIRSALDLAQSGCRVILTDREPNIGGTLSRLDRQFPTDRCGMCRMLPSVHRDSASRYCLRKGLFHENIEIMLSTELISLEGEAGNFRASLRQKPSLIDPGLCIGCGECAEACPVEVPDGFNGDLSMRKAVYLPVPHKMPNSFIIDTDSCTRCGACEKICPTDGIKLAEHGRKEFNILVIDDELIVRDSLKEWLEDEGYSADMAESGRDALIKLSERRYRLMLIDIKMAEMDGVTLLKKVKEEYPDIEVLMMTAYATVETAIGAMKLGAMDYLLKPFDPEAVLPKIAEIYEQFRKKEAKTVEAQALILSCGTDFYDPSQGKNTYGYGVYPGVVTSLEFERIISGTGPSGYGYTLKASQDEKKSETGVKEDHFSQHEKKLIRRIAWLQCNGSRDLQMNADFCSSVCCMYAVKEALMVKKESDGKAETVIFYMDMRTFGKSFQRYRDNAEKEHGVRFENVKIHSVIRESDNSNNRPTEFKRNSCDAEADGDDDDLNRNDAPNVKGILNEKDALNGKDNSGDLVVRYVNSGGCICEERFDMIILPVGQRAAKDSEKLSRITGISLNSSGFAETPPFLMTRTSVKGIMAGGSFSGLKDIGDSLITASSAANSALNIVKASGRDLLPPPEPKTIDQQLLREPPRIMVALCNCSSSISPYLLSSYSVNGSKKNLGKKEISAKHASATTGHEFKISGGSYGSGGSDGFDGLGGSGGFNLMEELKRDPDVSDVVMIDQLCTSGGWSDLVSQIREKNPNRLVVGACMPYLYNRKFIKSESETGLDAAFTAVADIRSPLYQIGSQFYENKNSLNMPSPDKPSQNKQSHNKPSHNKPSHNKRPHNKDEDSVIIHEIRRNIRMEISRMRNADPHNFHTIPVAGKALVVGGGIAGMTAALTIAENGFQVYLIEKSSFLGGNIRRLNETIEGYNVRELLSGTIDKVQNHPLIEVYMESEIISSSGEAGFFLTTVETPKNGKDQSISEIRSERENKRGNCKEWPEKEVITFEHGTTILATGGRETRIGNYGYIPENAGNAEDGKSLRRADKVIMTQLEFEDMISGVSVSSDDSFFSENVHSSSPNVNESSLLDIRSLSSVVMIQCAGTREEPRNYCSRVCCMTSLRQALLLKKENPDINITILYRDMMSYGFNETWYTKAREAGVLFIRYSLQEKPSVSLKDIETGRKNVQNTNIDIAEPEASADRAPEGAADEEITLPEKIVSIKCLEPITGRYLEIEADILVLAAGVVPDFPSDLAEIFGVKTDTDGFIREAESKWRPVDSLKDGIFSCGLVNSPRNITETIATAEAAAQRAIEILANPALIPDRITARVKQSICSLCGLCIDSCPYGARNFTPEHDKVIVNPVLCRGCGACASICPSKASEVEGFSTRQMFEMIDAGVV